MIGNCFWCNYYSPQCLKITEKVAFNIASEASYVYILSGQKLIKMPKMVHFGEFLKILRLNSVTRQVAFITRKLVENAKIQKLKLDILSDFQTLCKDILLNRN